VSGVGGQLPGGRAAGSKADREEGRPLFYVAVTRPRDPPSLTVPQRFYPHQNRGNGDRHMYAARTRFIPAPILDRFESCAWPPAPAAASAVVPTRAPVDIGARLRGMWKSA